MQGSAPPASEYPAVPPLSRSVIIVALVVSLLVGAAAISNQSYWIDEATSLIVAMAPDPAGAWQYAQAVGGSTIQMPLYHVYLYAWHKVLAGGEWTMRASNLPWFLLGQAAFLVFLRRQPRLALSAALLAAVSPTVWMYLDEARPYLMQYAAGCWFVAGLAVCSTAPAGGLVGKFPVPLLLGSLGLATFVLLGSSLLGVVWAAGFLCAFLWLYLTRVPESSVLPTLSRRSLGWLAVAAGVVLLVFAFYYLWTWSAAGRGYHRAGASLASLPYIAYEFLGFSGYGPGKLELRNSVVRAMLPALPALVPLGLVLAALLWLLLRKIGLRSMGRRALIAWFAALVLPSAVILSVLFLASYRPLPRHFIPALPAVILALAALVDLALRQRNVAWRIVAILLPALWLGSALNLRLRAVHAKDDYRTASRIAAAALDRSMEVWWAADAAAAYIYLTPVALEEVPGRAWAMQAPAWDDIRFKFPPRVIVISKPDIYDPQGAVARYAAENRFVPVQRLHAFTILTRPGDKLPPAQSPPTGE